MGEAYTEGHAAALLTQLPRGSRVTRAIDPSLEWDSAEWLLSLIEYDLRVLAWQKTKDAQHGRNKPKPPIKPESKPQVVDAPSKEFMDSVARALGIEIDEEVTECQHHSEQQQ